MTAQPLRNDNVYPLRMEDAIGVGDVQPENIPPASSTIAGALAINEEAAKPKKPRKRKSATGRKRGRPVKAKAPKVEAPAADPVPAVKIEPMQVAWTARLTLARNVAPSGEGVWDRLKRVKGDTWLIVAACFAAIALGTSIAFMVIR